MKVMKGFVCSLFVGLALLLAPPPGQALSLSVDSATVNIGDTFSINLNVANAVNLTSWQFDLTYNSAILEVTPTGVTESAFFTQGDSTVFIPGFVDNTSGTILGAADALMFQPPVNGSGVLATIQFKALAEGISQLTLSDTFLNLSGSGFTVANGSVCVTGGTTTCAPAVPEPSSLWLLGLGGLVFWGVTRWSRFGVSAI
jgi:hypothetical protein